MVTLNGIRGSYFTLSFDHCTILGPKHLSGLGNFFLQSKNTSTLTFIDQQPVSYLKTFFGPLNKCALVGDKVSPWECLHALILTATLQLGSIWLSLSLYVSLFLSNIFVRRAGLSKWTKQEPISIINYGVE